MQGVGKKGTDYLSDAKMYNIARRYSGKGIGKGSPNGSGRIGKRGG